MRAYNNFKYISFLILLFILTSCRKFETSKESADYLKKPKIEDVYFIESSKGKFTLMKIANIEEEDIHFKLNKMNVTASQFLDETTNSIKFKNLEYLNKQQFWADSIKSYKKQELVKLYNDNVIYEIKRP